VQRGATESSGFRKRMLKLGSHRALTNKEMARWPAIGDQVDDRARIPRLRVFGRATLRGAGGNPKGTPMTRQSLALPRWVDVSGLFQFK
jgi:hypothetical protein